MKNNGQAILHYSSGIYQKAALVTSREHRCLFLPSPNPIEEIDKCVLVKGNNIHSKKRE